MSYCVNCGVELDKSAKKCALCGTRVINPNQPEPNDAEPSPFAERIIIPRGIRRRYAAFITTMVILIPNIVCLLINLVFSFDYNWATYVNSISLLFWIVVVFPFFIKKPKSYVVVAVDALSIFLFLAVIYQTSDGKGWLMKLALPIIVVGAVFLIAMTEWIKYKKLDWPLIVSAVLIQTSIASFAFEFVIRTYLGLSMLPLVSIIIAACCCALGIFFLAVFRNKRLKAWLSRKFFI